MKHLALLLACLMLTDARAAITVNDDDGKPVTLSRPARKVIALAPHVTELLFAAGGGDRIVATVSYSDYPEAAKSIPRIGSNLEVDIERLIAMKPDLVVVWMHGGGERQVAQLRALGVPVFHSDPRKLADIADNLAKLGKLMGTETVADPAAAALRKKLADLGRQYASRPPVRVFYQVWDKPLYTLSGAHIVSDAIRLCGGENIFAKLTATAPIVDVEAVLLDDPEVVISSGERSPTDGGIMLWKPYTNMTAVRRDNLFRIDGNLLNRSGPRMIDGAEAMCAKIELARQRRKHP